MYLWNFDHLARDLANQKITEKEGLHYFLASTLLILFQTYYAMWWGVDRSWLFFFDLLVLTVIAVIGCTEAFKANGANSGTSFVLRVICLSVPAGIRIAIFSITFGELLYFNAKSIFSTPTFANPEQAYLIISHAGFIGFSILYWWFIYNGFRKIQIHHKNHPEHDAQVHAASLSGDRSETQSLTSKSGTRTKKVALVALYVVSVLIAFLSGVTLSYKQSTEVFASGLAETQAMLWFNHLQQFREIESDLEMKGCEKIALEKTKIAIDGELKLLSSFHREYPDSTINKYISDRDSELLDKLKNFKSKYGDSWTIPQCGAVHECTK